MGKELVAINEMPAILMKELSGVYSRKEKLTIIKRFVSVLFRCSQRLSALFEKFECVFKVTLTNSIKKTLFEEKKFFDSKGETNDERIEQIALYFLDRSPCCEDEIVRLRRYPTQNRI